MTGTNNGASAAERVYAALKRDILQGRLEPGAQLSERWLAASYDTSRIPLRDALKRLIIEGFVVSEPRRGTSVSRLSDRDLQDLFEVRENLEVLAARLAAQRRDDDGLRRLSARLAEARGGYAAGDHMAAARANAEFHAEVIAVAGNVLLQSIMQPLNDRIQWVFGLYTARDGAVLMAEHQQLLDAIAAGDPDTAARIAVAHVRGGRHAEPRSAAAGPAGTPCT